MAGKAVVLVGGPGSTISRRSHPGDGAGGGVEVGEGAEVEKGQTPHQSC